MRIGLLLCLCIGLSGCGPKLKFDQTKAVTVSDPWTDIIDAFSSEAKIKVEATSSDEPFHVFILKQEDVDKADTGMQDGKAPATALGHQLNTRSASFEVTAPAGKEVAFYVVSTGKKANVTLKMNK